MLSCFVIVYALLSITASRPHCHRGTGEPIRQS
jgi:hypothetical protein